MAGTAKVSSRERVRVFLESHNLLDGLVECEQSTKTAAEAADAAGCELGQIVKSLVLTVGETPVLALVAGDRRADFDEVARACEQRGIVGKVAMASAEVTREVTGYAIGGVCPFDLPDDLFVMVDSSFERFDVLTPAAGTPQSFCHIARDKFDDIVKGVWVSVGK